MLSSIWVLSANESYPTVCQSLQTRWDGVFSEVEEKKSKKMEKIVMTRIVAVSLRVVQLHLSTLEISFAISQAVTFTGLLTLLRCTGVSSAPGSIPSA